MNDVVVTKDNFDEEVLHSTLPVLIDFFAEWCGPCHMLTPVMEELAKQYDKRIKVFRINVDEQEELAASFQVQSIPMVVFLKDGKIMQSMIGYRPIEEFTAVLDKLI